jgi:hypothetical protein
MAGITTNPTRASVARSWVGDYLDREHMVAGGAKLDPTQFVGEGTVRAVVGAAGAAQGATSIPVAALSGAIPSGSLLDFGGAKFARTTAVAASGATTITVSALPTALVSGDTANYLAATAMKVIPSGTVLGRTFSERDANTPFGPAADADDEVYLLVFDVINPTTAPADCELYRWGSIVKENLLGTFAALSATLKGKIRTNYQCVKGAN